MKQIAHVIIAVIVFFDFSRVRRNILKFTEFDYVLYMTYIVFYPVLLVLKKYEHASWGELSFQRIVLINKPSIGFRISVIMTLVLEHILYSISVLTTDIPRISSNISFLKNNNTSS